MKLDAQLLLDTFSSTMAWNGKKWMNILGRILFLTAESW